MLLHRKAPDIVWALPGGQVACAESAAEALVREFSEELSCSAICGRLVYVAENFFGHADSRRHELGLYFLVSLQSGSLPAPGGAAFAGTEIQKGLEFRWVERSDLANVELRPSFLVAALATPELEFRHVVERPSPLGG